MVRHLAAMMAVNLAPTMDPNWEHPMETHLVNLMDVRLVEMTVAGKAIRWGWRLVLRSVVTRASLMVTYSARLKGNHWVQCSCLVKSLAPGFCLGLYLAFVLATF